MVDPIDSLHPPGASGREKTRQELEAELREAHELIEAIRSGKVDVVRGRGEDNTLLNLERIEMVEERKQLLHKLQETNDNLQNEIKTRTAAEASLQAALSKANEAALLRDKFVSLVSHDLRAPLATISGFMRLLRTRLASGEDKESVLIADKAISITGKMDRLIEELLEVGRLKSGTIQLKYGFVNVYLMVVKALHLLEDHAGRKGVILINKVPGRMFAYADEPLLTQVIQNLVSNAIKFCGRGDMVTISASDSDRAIIKVADTGIGMGPDLVKGIFDYGQKSNRVGTDGETGAGLGLPLSHDIVAAHGGLLEVESAPGRGSVFTITLAQVKPRILLIDDDADSLEGIRRILAPVDAEIITSSSGGGALELAEARHPHLIILDLFMPGLDGFAVLEMVRAHPVLKAVPVIVLSVTGETASREAALRLGANDFVTKANQADELLPRIGKYIGYRTISSATAARTRMAESGERRILFLEDDETLLAGMTSFFEDNGITVTAALNEKTAIEIYAGRAKPVDALLVDMRPPFTSGLELARLNYESLLLPMVIFTSKADAKLALEFTCFGVKDYLVKPVDSQFLLGVLENAIRRQSITGPSGTGVELEGNVDSITFLSRRGEIKKALGWMERRVKPVLGEAESRRFSVYASEFLLNAHEHGNLKLNEQDKVELLNRGIFDVEVERREQASHAQIRMALSALSNEVALNVADEGSGFRFMDYLQMREEEILRRLDMPCGRGILMARKYFDHIEYTRNGASVTLVKKIRIPR